MLNILFRVLHFYLPKIIKASKQIESIAGTSNLVRPSLYDKTNNFIMKSATIQTY